MENDPTQKPDHRNNPLLRREAGEGWHPDGMSNRLLGALLAREALGDELENASDDEAREEIMLVYQSQVERVNGIKEELGIGDAPPMPQE